MTRFGATVCCSLLIGLGVACDRQVDTSYQGESLMQIHGSVAIPLGLEGSSFVPAIAWYARAGSGPFLRISQASVTGDFPSKFTLDVYDPAPHDALSRHDIPGEPAYAEGRVTAVAPDYPTTISTNSIPNGCGEYCFLNLVCEGAESASDPSDSHTDCYQQQVDCRAQFEGATAVGELDVNSCSLRGTGGNAELAFGGVSKDVAIVYFDAPVAADTILANRFGDGDAIAAGYHVYRIRAREPDVPERAADYMPSERDLCVSKAVTMALARFNAEHGTNYGPMEQWWGTTGTPRAEYYDYERTILRVKRELGCTRPSSDYVPVDLAAESIAIELGLQTLQALGF